MIWILISTIKENSGAFFIIIKNKLQIMRNFVLASLAAAAVSAEYKTF